MKKFLKISATLSLLVLALALTVFSAEGTALAKEALRLCASCVIPSLFPYMVVSSMLISSNAADHLGKLFPVSRLAGLPDNATSPMLLGAVCGFPVGAKSCVDMFKKGSLSKEEAEVLISYSNNTGPSFIVSVIGASFFQSRRFGWQLFASQLISSFIAATIVNKLIFPYKKSRKKGKLQKLNLPDLPAAVKDSAFSVITVCAFIVFFNVMLGYLKPLLSPFSPKLSLFLCSLTEFTAACRSAALEGGLIGRFFAGLSIGFSGMSVLCQTAAFTGEEGLSLKRCVCTKGLQGVFTGMLALIGTKIPNDESLVSIPMFFGSSDLILSDQSTAAICLMLYLSLIKIFIKNDKMKKHLDL